MKAKVIGAMLVMLAMVSATSADGFGTDGNQFTIDFVTISGDAGDLGNWPAGSGYIFTGVKRDDYRIGVYEITNDQWNKFKAELGVPVTGVPYHAHNDDARYTDPDVPTNNASWYEAAQFVNWLNTSTRHQAAYRFTGTQGTSDYALGTWSAGEADGSNLYRHKDAFYYLPTEPEWVKAGYWNDTNLQLYATPGDTEPVAGVDTNYNTAIGREPWNIGSGSKELNGTFDIMGNVWEWMESPFTSGDYGTDSIRSQRGGSPTHSANILTSSLRNNIGPSGEHYYVGFRVASEVPEPTTLSLLAIGGLAMLRRRRK